MQANELKHTAARRRQYTRENASTQRSLAATRHVVMVAFPGAELLDVVGPLEIFSAASHLLREERGSAFTAYTHEIIVSQAGPLLTASGIRLVADRSIRQMRGELDTLFVAGLIASTYQPKKSTLHIRMPLDPPLPLLVL